MPLNTSVHKMNDYDNINTNLITTMRQQQHHFYPLRKGGQKTNYERKIRNLSVNNKFVHKNRNNFFDISKRVESEKEKKAAHHQNQQNRSYNLSTITTTAEFLRRRRRKEANSIERQKPSSTLTTTSLLTKTTKSIQIPCTKQREETKEKNYCELHNYFQPIIIINSRHEKENNNHRDHYHHLLLLASKKKEKKTTTTDLKSSQIRNQDLTRYLSTAQSRSSEASTAHSIEQERQLPHSLLLNIRDYRLVEQRRQRLDKIAQSLHFVIRDTKHPVFTTSKMDSNFYTNTYNQHSHYSQPSVYSVHSNFQQQQQQQTQSTQQNNIYSTFGSNVFLDQKNMPHGSYRESISSKTSKIPESPRASQKHPKNKSRIEQPSTRQSSYNTYPSNYNSFRGSTTSSQNPNEYRAGNVYSNYYNYSQSAATSTPYTSYATYHKNNDSHNQINSEDIFLILEDAYEPNKKIVQMTRTVLGPDGEQQRVTVERDFKNENELNIFLKQLGENMNKSSSNTPKAKKQTGSFHSSFSKLNKSDTDDLIKSPGVIVVEEPGEEPKLYRQDTGELVTSTAEFIDPLRTGENNENPEELPKSKEKAGKYPSSSHSKLYKDIDALIATLKREDRNLKSSLTMENSKVRGGETQRTKSFSSRRNSVHVSNLASKQETQDKKEKRYSYNPRGEIKEALKKDLDKYKQTTLQSERNSDSKQVKEDIQRINSGEVKSKTSNNGSAKKSHDAYGTKKDKNKIETIMENITLSDKLPKKIYIPNDSAFERPRSVSSKPVSRKIRHHRTFNEKDLTRPVSTCPLIEKKSPSSTKNSANQNELECSKTCTVKDYQSKNLGDLNDMAGMIREKKISSSENKEKERYHKQGNRVSFQPSTEFLKHYKSTGISKMGAATSTGIKRTASASSTLKKNSIIAKSESASGCSKNDLISKLAEKQAAEKSHTVNYTKMKSNNKIKDTVGGSSQKDEKESSVYASVTKYKHYPDLFDTTSDCSTIGDIKNQNILSNKMAKCNLSKRHSLNVPKNICKSIDSVMSHVNTADEILSKNSKSSWVKKKLYQDVNEPQKQCSKGHSHSTQRLNNIDNKTSILENQIYANHIVKHTCEHTVSSKKYKKRAAAAAEVEKALRESLNGADTFTSKRDCESNENCSTLVQDNQEIDLDCSSSSNSDTCINGLKELNGYEDNFCLYDHNYTDQRTCQSQTEDFYARQNQIYANFRQIQPSPAFFQPGFYQRSNTPQSQVVQDPLQSSHSQNVFNHYQQQQQQQQQQQMYFNRQSNYYASWYGSTPSLRIPDRNTNRQSFYFN